MDELDALTIDEIRNRLSKAHTGEVIFRYPPGLLSGPFRPAAVLIPLLRHNNQWQLLFIRRTDNQNDPHSGQVAFPGGASDPDDSNAEMTAIREANEEIGIKARDVTILGMLNDFITITSYQVTPVVGKIPWPYPLQLAAEEVSRAFTIPLAWLADPDNSDQERRRLPPPFEPIPVIYFKPYLGEVLWGATAGFTFGLLQTLIPRFDNIETAP